MLFRSKDDDDDGFGGLDDDEKVSVVVHLRNGDKKRMEVPRHKRGEYARGENEDEKKAYRAMKVMTYVDRYFPRQDDPAEDPIITNALLRQVKFGKAYIQAYWDTVQ